MCVELTITIRDEEKRKLIKSFLIYEPFCLSENDPTVKACLKELLDEFKGEPDDVKLKATMILQ